MFCLKTLVMFNVCEQSEQRLDHCNSTICYYDAEDGCLIRKGNPLEFNKSLPTWKAFINNSL
ncbi:uncharacterized protein Dvir_GJ26685 [Drosophila virilis]|uniref:Uncharacterized protein n=1 Tax=Drosophila virilis TaxID=7244 RepID=A0A0Q9WWX0_DROVI|nr:uncharacterized protein Dvir_GJ26685 [Drosophila virilis]